MIKIDWCNIQRLDSKSYQCGYCNEKIASEKGYFSNSSERNGIFSTIYICHKCNKASFFDEKGEKTPGSLFGENVDGIDDSTVEKLYDEARACYSTNSFTAVVLSCRKILMHVAVNKGAKQDLKFIEYVEYLSEQNFIPPGSKEWVDQIRKKGNEANHEIIIMTAENAKDLLSFIQMLLKIIYEFPAAVKRIDSKSK